MTKIPPSDLVLLDTNILVAYIRANKLSEYIESEYELLSRPERPLICVVTIGEIFALAADFKWGSPKIEKMRELLRELVAVDISDDSILEKYAEIRSNLKNQTPSITIQQNDMWIAAVASVTGAHLISTDTDFKRIPPSFIQLHWIDETVTKA